MHFSLQCRHLLVKRLKSSQVLQMKAALQLVQRLLQYKIMTEWEIDMLSFIQ